MEFNRDLLVTQLRADGDDETADRAERELPPSVSTEEHQALFDKLGIDDSVLLKVPGAETRRTPPT